MKLVSILRHLLFSYILLYGINSLAQTNATGQVSRDWKTYPAILKLTTMEDIYAIGDAHGDPNRLANVLLSAGLISALPETPDQVKWKGGKATLVVTGDMIDKWTESIAVIALLRALQSDAVKHGGQVIITMGNHEAEFLAAPTGKKNQRICQRVDCLWSRSEYGG